MQRRLTGRIARPTARLLVGEAALAEAVDAARVKLLGYRALREPHARSLIRPGRSAGVVPARGRGDQNSVISKVSTWSCLYSAEFVIGSIAMSFAMLPVTFTRPCMNAALASSSFFWMRMASS